MLGHLKSWNEIFNSTVYIGLCWHLKKYKVIWVQTSTVKRNLKIFLGGNTYQTLSPKNTTLWAFHLEPERTYFAKHMQKNTILKQIAISSYYMYFLTESSVWAPFPACRKRKRNQQFRCLNTFVTLPLASRIRCLHHRKVLTDTSTRRAQLRITFLRRIDKANKLTVLTYRKNNGNFNQIHIWPKP